MAEIKKQESEQADTRSDEEKLAETIDFLKRTQANFENYRKQTEKRIEEIRKMAAKDVIIQMLPIVDNLELALKNSHVEKDDFLKGIELIYAQLNTFLENSGVQAIQTENQRFDPYFHEALMKVDSDQPENMVLEEIQRGFVLHGNVIRHAKVKISSAKQAKQKENNSGGDSK